MKAMPIVTAALERGDLKGVMVVKLRKQSPPELTSRAYRQYYALRRKKPPEVVGDVCWEGARRIITETLKALAAMRATAKAKRRR